MQVQVIGKPLSYGKRTYQIGELVSMPSKHARVFALLRRVREPVYSDIPAAPSLNVVITDGAGYEREDIEAEISPRTED